MLVVLVVGLALLVSGGDDRDGGPPAALATRLVPADALVYVHLSTDTGRRGTAAAERLAQAFPGYDALRKSLVKRLSAPGCPVAADALKNGREAALALIDTGSEAAGSLVYVDTGNTDKLPERTCGAVQTGKFGRFLVIGQPQTIVLARQLAAGKGRSLADVAAYRRGLDGLPAGRVADAWATADGVDRLLAPQGGILGVAGSLLRRPGGAATIAAVVPAEQGARVIVRTLSRTPATTSSSSFRPFTPTIQGELPDSAMGFLAVEGISGAAAQLLGLAGLRTPGLGALLARAGKDLQPLARLFDGEVGVTVTRATPTAILTLVTRTPDPAAARRTLASLRPKIARLLARSPDNIPVWKAVGSTYRLRPSSGLELDYDIVGDLIVVSTRQAGIDGVRTRQGRLPDTAGWRAAVGKASNPVSSLGFLDFNQLLRLGEQTGLDENRAYLAAKADLQRLRSVGVRSSTEGDESTVELFLSFP
ncbi:hypothetical protein DSM112329_02201 [Paraconexibacter sp. AEG42_29]|uniref:DUF3352 domain-containing protein n=1 Tax=Paraconexibacter sp. AEG42_29 TaxID=2997339 RepID=A0AAU7AUS9_9ACTN